LHFCFYNYTIWAGMELKDWLRLKKDKLSQDRPKRELRPNPYPPLLKQLFEEAPEGSQEQAEALEGGQ
jgi:hypothetical protein